MQKSAVFPAAILVISGFFSATAVAAADRAQSDGQPTAQRDANAHVDRVPVSFQALTAKLQPTADSAQGKSPVRVLGSEKIVTRSPNQLGLITLP